MKKHLLLTSFVLLALIGQGQNLVPNPSFEQHIGCPDNLDQLYKATGWSSFGGTPDYCHVCSPSTNVGIPNNFLGFELPHILTDSAYCAIATYVQGQQNGREFIGTQLINPLNIGTKYFASIKVSAASNGTSNFQCFNDKIGLLFSTIPYSSSNSALVNNFAHVYSNSMITDTVNWVVISGSFVADSTYKYLSIGNFFDDINTDTVFCSGSYAYYYIDDVCISPDSNSCDLATKLQEIKFENSVEIYPNPAKDLVSVRIKEPNANNIEIVIYNSLGISMRKLNNASILEQINLNQYSSGIYIIKIAFSNQEYLRKLIIY